VAEVSNKGGIVARAVRSVTSSVVATRDAPVTVPGQQAGWSSGLGGGWTRRTVSEQVSSPLNVYGGTNESVTWVYACVTLRAQSLGAYPWWLHDSTAPRVAISRESRRGEVRELYDLLDEPNDEQTYFDFAESIVTDLDLAGNSWWLLDNQNGLGQPERIERLMPGTVKVVVNDRGRRTGYVYEPKPNLRIPLKLEDIMHVRYPNPLNRYYGMGIVEALIRAVDGNLSQTQHVTAFFQQGAHLSGVLTVPETVTDEEFQRMKAQYQDEFNDSDSTFRVLIAEGSTGYVPISQGPATLGINDLLRSNKDEILSGFGVPEFLLGGTGQGGVYKMEEAQNIFYRAMIPLARRISTRIKMDLASRFMLDLGARQRPLGFLIDPRQSDTQSSKVERARKLVGTGATIDDMREEAGQERLNWPGVTDLPAIPSGLVLVTQSPTEDNVVAGGVSPPPQPEGGTDPNNQPGGDGESNDSAADGNPDEVSSGSQRSLLPALPLAPQRALPAPQTSSSDARQAPPALTHSPEVRAAVDATALCDDLTDTLRGVFTAQRQRAIDALSQYGSVDGAKLSSKPRYKKSDLTPDLVASVDIEARDLQQRLESRGFAEHFDEAVASVCEATDAVKREVEVGIQRGYSVAQIANGFPAENYAGIVGTLDPYLINVAPAEAARLLSVSTAQR
jgi:HK97 family phage portal protein